MEKQRLKEKIRHLQAIIVLLEDINYELREQIDN
jgi:hypothetical protein